MNLNLNTVKSTALYPMNLLKPTASSSSSAPSGITAALLLAAAGNLLAAGSLLAQATASETTYDESSAPSGDFGNSFALRTTLTLGTTQINGTPFLFSDPDFFSIGGLSAGATYTLSISAGDPSGGYSATIQGYDDAGTAIGTAASYTSSDPANTLRSITGFVPASGILTIGANPQSNFAEVGTSPGLRATLAVVPEPATTSLIALGAALATVVARRRRQPDAAQ